MTQSPDEEDRRSDEGDHGKSPDGDRALVNQAPAGLGPSGVDRFCEAGVWTAEMKAAAMQDAQNVCDLSVLVVRFIRRVQKGLPLAELAVQADDFLKRKGLYGSPLRERDTRPKDGDPSGAPLASSPVPEGNSPDPAANKSASLTPQNLEAKAREIAVILSGSTFSDPDGGDFRDKAARLILRALREERERAADEITRLRSDNQKLREALKPFGSVHPSFAGVEDILWGHLPDDEPAKLTVKLRDLRRARAVLTGTEAPPAAESPSDATSTTKDT